jgi:neutral ceramidase
MNETMTDLSAGAGQADVTPAMGIQIAGDIGRYRPVEQIRDPLFVRALVLQSGGETACIITADLNSISERHAAAMRQWVSDYLGTRPEAVMVHATQTHSAPVVGNEMLSDDFPLPSDLWWLRGADERYHGPFYDGFKAAVKQARESLRPATLKAVRGIDGRVAFNRRYILRDGTHRSQPGRCYSEILRPEGPADPEVGVAVVEDGAGKTLAALLHHTCHPCHGYPHRWISADWPGFWSQAVRYHFGGSCVALTLNGFCGNILHGNPLDPDSRSNIYLMGERLMETTRRILPDLKPLAGVPLVCSSRVLPIPMRKLSAAEVERARTLIKEHPGPMWKDEARTNIEWDWVYALATLDLAEKQKKRQVFDYEVQVFRIGDLAVVGCPGEPFVEAQLDIKCGSPAKQTFVAHLCNGGASYVPTRQAFAYGGYETRVANWSCLDEGALEMVTATAREVLRDLYA